MCIRKQITHGIKFQTKFIVVYMNFMSILSENLILCINRKKKNSFCLLKTFNVRHFNIKRTHFYRQLHTSYRC